MSDLVYVNSIIINSSTFSNKTGINSINCTNKSWYNNSMYQAFYNCTNLSEVSNLNDSVTNLTQSFKNCTNLFLPPKLPDSCVTLQGCFENCKNLLITPIIPNSVSDLSTAFQGCSNLLEPKTIPDSVTNMYATFKDCINLDQLIIPPKNIIDLPFTFSNTGITNVGMLCSNQFNSITSLTGTFMSCPYLTTISNGIWASNNILPNNITDLNSTFANTNINVFNFTSNGLVNMVNTFSNCKKLYSTRLIDSPNVQNISYAFKDCSELGSISNFSNSIVVMDGTFQNCTYLRNVPTLPNSVVSMKDTFAGCTKINIIPHIPNSVKYITSGIGLFSNCINLTGDIYITSNQIVDATNTFANSPLPKNVYVPFTNEDSSLSATYNAFIEAGYDENGTKDNVYLKNSLLYKVFSIESQNIATISIEAGDKTFNRQGMLYTLVPNNTQVKYKVEVTNYNYYNGYQVIENTMVITENTYLNIPVQETEEKTWNITYDDSKYAPSYYNNPSTYFYIQNTSLENVNLGTDFIVEQVND